MSQQYYYSTLTGQQLDAALEQVSQVGASVEAAARSAEAAAESARLAQDAAAGNLPVGGENLGGVKNGGNVVINADGTMDAPIGGSNQPLTFTGAVSATYDGSSPVSVEIPQGGGGAEWEIIRDITLEDEVTLNIIVTTKDNGETFNYKKVACAVVVGDTALPSGWNNLAINPDPSHNVVWNGDEVVKRYFSPAAKKTYFFSYELMGDSVVNQYVAEEGGNVVLSSHWRKGDSITEAAWVKAYETEITGVSYQVNGTYPVGSRFIFYGMK